MPDNSKREKHRGARQPNWALGVALGVGTGAAMGVATDNVAGGLAIGAALMVVFAFALGRPKQGTGDGGAPASGGPDQPQR